ncbi:MAG: UDP-N-acetylmuramate dehydrogenase [Campylobacter sp.]|nr:UDP-N-acetylmuramate dehydrogenase [Campylobacter sp.]
MNSGSNLGEFALIDFSKYSSIKIGPLVKVEILSFENASKFDGVVVGGANNLLISPNPPRLGILDKKFDSIELNGEILKIGAFCKSGKIYNFAKKFNIAEFEFVKNIPGTLGGMLKMNAGLLGREISANLLSVRTNLGEFDKNAFEFGYRQSSIKGVIFEATLKVKHGFDESLSSEISQKRVSQPKAHTFGSVFKNPNGDYAGRLIESVGLKGHKIGGVGFSDKHANFMINYGGGKFDEAIELIILAKKRVFESYGIKLECEVKIV